MCDLWWFVCAYVIIGGLFTCVVFFFDVCGCVICVLVCVECGAWACSFVWACVCLFVKFVYVCSCDKFFVL